MVWFLRKVLKVCSIFGLSLILFFMEKEFLRILEFVCESVYDRMKLGSVISWRMVGL